MDTKFHDIVDIFHVIDVIIFYISKMMNLYLILEILNRRSNNWKWSGKQFLKFCLVELL